MKVSIVGDNPNSWMNSYAKEFLPKLRCDANFYIDHESITKGDIAFFLSCEKKISKQIMSRNTHNIVIHASELPKGKGWSPVTWQIIEGKNHIPLTLFEADEKIDSGKVYMRDYFELEGHELIEEIREILVGKIFSMINRFIEKYPNWEGTPQKGEESFYKKRTPGDSLLDTDKTIAEQFDLLRVVDNERYPAFFEFQGHKYVLSISKADRSGKGT